MERDARLFVGIDVGTSGVRALVVDEAGSVLGRSTVPLDLSGSAAPPGIHEQPPEAWWSATCAALQTAVSELGGRGIAREDLVALAVDGTSGTLVCLDGHGGTLRPAIMYNDARAEAEGQELTAMAGSFCEKLGYRFGSSYALAKILWVQRHEPRVFERAEHVAHQADYIVGRLTGKWGVSDYSNALKTGFDLVDDRWPGWFVQLPGILERLPRIVPPGTHVGGVNAQAADATGLPRGLTVVTGASDGTAACLASGLRDPGDYNTTLGTTLVFKGLSRSLCSHPDGIIYSHKLPGGMWLPGAASNTGGEWVGALFPGDDLSSLDAAAEPLLPNPHIAYPLVRKGERFPFLCADAEGFCIPTAPEKSERYAAHLQGTAFVERLAYDVLDATTYASGGRQQSCRLSGAVFSTGGGSASGVWMQCRADATGRIIHRPECPESAFGSAILAAAATVFGDIWEAVAAMVRVERSFAPEASTGGRYNELFGEFCAELEKRGWLRRERVQTL